MKNNTQTKKGELYEKAHIKIGNKFGLSSSKIRFIRDCFYNLKLNKIETMHFAARKNNIIQQAHVLRQSVKKDTDFYGRIWRFLKECKDEELEEILQPIELDK